MNSRAGTQGIGSRVRPLVAVLGIVYGDIGTSPLYAMRECFHGPHSVAAGREAVFGVLSLIAWSLILVISLKYLAWVLRADNRGEGGVLSLMALVAGAIPRVGRLARHPMLVLVGLFGAALLYGDSLLTPAISVLSAVEGLSVVTPAFSAYVVPLTLAILVLLFAVQRRGTSAIGGWFGPVTIVWFLTLAALGVASLARTPEVVAALDPRHGARFFAEHGGRGFLVLGSVFLVVTGGEALYADMGQFGLRPIRRAWFSLVLPALLLNYFGQGALLLRSPEAAANPFYLLAPPWALLPLVGLATATTVIASQAVITGAFSVTWQAIQLGYLPRLAVRHTSQGEMGHVYLPGVNFALLAATLLLVLAFRSSSALAGAYGIAIASTMAITTVLMAAVTVKLWRWNRALALALAALFLSADAAFFAANAGKVVEGGWFPLLLGALVAILMTTWSTGRSLLDAKVGTSAVDAATFSRALASGKLARIPRTMVFVTRDRKNVPPALAAMSEHLKAAPARAILVTVETQNEPHVAPGRRFDVQDVGGGMHRVHVRYGYMDSPNLPVVMSRLSERGLRVDVAGVVYVVGRTTPVSTSGGGMARWREKLFVAMARNAGGAADFYRLPAAQVLEVGTRLEM